MEETVYKREFVEGLADVQEDIRLYIRSVLLNCQDSVDDVVQETNLALLRHAPEYDTSKPFRPWAFGFAKQQVLVFRRKQKADRLVLGEEAVNRIAEAYTEVPRQTEKSLPIFRRLAICKKRLSDGERTLLDLRYGDNLTPREIAERRNLTSRKIRNELMCIRRRLSDCIHRLCRMSEGTLDKEGEAIDSFDKELSELMDSSFFPRQVRKVLGMANASRNSASVTRKRCRCISCFRMITAHRNHAPGSGGLRLSPSQPWRQRCCLLSREVPCFSQEKNARCRISRRRPRRIGRCKGHLLLLGI